MVEINYNEKQIELLLGKRKQNAEVTERDFGSDVVVAGYIKNIADLGKNMKFLTLADASGEIQLTLKKGVYVGVEDAKMLTPHTFIVAKGEACKGRAKDGREVLVKDISLLSDVVTEKIPTEMRTSLDKRLDYRWVDLRNEKHRFPLTMVSEFTRYSRDFFNENGFTEIFTPKIVGTPTEGGAEAFPVLYFDREAYLAQSPQFYKQMAICSGFDRVFEIAPVFRANPSHTTRHDTEYTSLDFEIGYITSHQDVMKAEEGMLSHVFKNIKEKYGDKIRKKFKQEIDVPKNIPQIRMEEAYEIVTKEDVDEKGSLRPSGEKAVSEHVKEAYGSDFIFITDFPYDARPFYHMKGEAMRNGKETTKSFDLIYRGVEITTGAQREHRHGKLTAQVVEKGLSTNNLKQYLDFFKYGAPPHGGIGLSPSRVVTNMLDLGNVREATMAPRDPKRLFP
ncbi:MAG: aspartate--tRNA(Asn) ligase [Candidatus Aenigmatarchaeota archaeon]